MIQRRARLPVTSPSLYQKRNIPGLHPQIRDTLDLCHISLSLFFLTNEMLNLNSRFTKSAAKATNRNDG